MNITRIALALVLAALFAVPAMADVVSTLSTAGNDVVTWIRAAVIFVAIAVGIAMCRNGFNIFGMIPIIIGFIIATQPQIITSWLK